MEEKAPTVTIAPEERWAQGVPHDERSRELYDFIAAYDWAHCEDFFSFSSGGDGDNGEQLMYLMDEYFAMKDQTGQ